MQAIIAELEKTSFGSAEAHKATVLDILKRGGARTSLDIF